MPRIVLLTGPPRVGKTTVVVRTVERVKDEGVGVAGFWTEEVRVGGARIGFDIVRIDGRRTPLSRKDTDSDVRVGSYGVLVDEASAAFDDLRDTIADGMAGVWVVDEFGPMELKIPAFRILADAVVGSGADVLATYRQGRRDPHVERLRSVDDARDWTVTRENRDELPKRVAEVLISSTGKR